MATAMLALCCASFTSKAEKKPPYSESTLRWIVAQPCFHFATAEPATENTKRYDLGLYWYSYPGDQFQYFNTIPNEEWRLWVLLGGVEVDTNPMGGTLLEKGYLLPGIPHLLAYSFLYGHFLM